MASSASSGFSTMRNSSSDEQITDQRKRKRMISNRESARRSRQKKQKQLDELLGFVNQLKQENNQIFNTIDMTTQLYLNIETENSVFRAQIVELNQRLQSLIEITSLNDDQIHVSCFDPLMNTWSASHQQQIMY